MKARPIGFSVVMVPLVLNDEKTQTRRVLKPQPMLGGNAPWMAGGWYPSAGHSRAKHYANEKHFKRGMPIDFCPYGRSGDRLYISEQIEWLWVGCDARGHWVGDLRYRADGLERRVEIPDRVKHPSIGYWPGRTLPIEWARPDRLEIVEVRVERVRDISAKDAKAEGVLGWRNGWSKKQAAHAFLLSGSGQIPTGKLGVPRALFMMLWDSINGKKKGCTWRGNPWCRCVSFRRVTDGN